MKRLITAVLLALFSGGIANALEDLQFLRPLRTQSVHANTTSKRIATALTGFPMVVRILSQQDAFISVGVSNANGQPFNNLPVATNLTGMPIPASSAVFIRLNPGELIAVKMSTTAGTVFFTEMGK